VKWHVLVPPESLISLVAMRCMKECRYVSCISGTNPFIAHLFNIGAGDSAEISNKFHPRILSKAHVGKAVAGRVRDCSPIPAICLGRRKLVRRVSLAAWLERNEHLADHRMFPTGATITALPERDAAKHA